MASRYKLYALYGDESTQLRAVVQMLERRGYTKVRVLKDWQQGVLERSPRYQALIGCAQV